MNLTSAALKNPWNIIALVALIIALGVFAFLRVPTDLFPETAPPQVAIMTVLPGASAADMEDKITTVVEKELKSISGLKRLVSTSRDEVSSINAEFLYAKPIGEAVVDVQNAISRIRGDLPADIREPLLFRITDATRPLVTLALKPAADSGKDLSDIRLLAENQIRDRLLGIEGIADVEVFGGYQPEVSVEVKREALHAHGLTLQDVMAALARQNVSSPGGTLYTDSREHLLRIAGEFTSLDSIRNMPLQIPGAAEITLDEIAEVSLEHADLRSFYHGNAEAAIAVNLLRAEGGHTVAAIDNFKAAFPELKNEFGDIQFEITDDQEPLIDLNVSGMRSSLVQAVVLTVVIILMFLANLRAAAVVSVSIPLAFLSAMSVLWFSPFTLNMVTLSGLIISVGMVVDASVVVLENIYRHHEQSPSTSPALVSEKGAHEVAAPVTAGMLTTVVVVFPVLFSSGYTGTIMRPLNLMIIVTLVASLLISLTLVPLLTARLLQRGDAKAKRESTTPKPVHIVDRVLQAIARFYLGFVRLALRHRLIFLGLALVFLIFTFRVAKPLLGGEQMPPMDTGISLVAFDTPASTPPHKVKEVLTEVEQIVRTTPGVTWISSVVGSEPAAISFGGGGATAQSAQLTIHLVPRTERDATIWEIEERWRAQLREVADIKSFRVSEYGATPVATTKAPFNLVISGPDTRVLDRLAEEAMQRLQQVRGLTDLRRSWHMDKLEQNIVIDPHIARLYSTSPAALGDTVRSAIQGGIASSMRLDQFLDIPIRVRLAQEFRHSTKDLDEIYIPVKPAGTESTPVQMPLSSLAQIEEVYTQPFQTREHLRSTVDITAGNRVRTIAEVSANAMQALKGISLPAGYSMEMAGSVRDMQESQGELGRALSVGLVLLFILLMALFRSVLHPVTIMLSIPLALAGAVWGLLVFNKPMCMPAMMGMILLGGTIVNNAILMLDFIVNARADGMEKNDAILQAVELRLRPILMTATSTVIGFSPLIFEMAVGLERMSPLGIAAASGLILGTVVTLVYVPLIYSVADSFATRVRGGFIPARSTSAVLALLTAGLLATVWAPAQVQAKTQEQKQEQEHSRKGEHLSLDAAIRMALAHNPGLKAARAEVEMQHADANLARAPLRPRLDLAAQSAWSEEDHAMIPGLAPGSQSFADNLHQLTLEARYLLTDFGARRSALDAALQYAAAQNSAFERREQELIYSTARAYLEVLTYTELHSAAQASRSSLVEVRDNTAAMLEQGRAAKLDMLKARTGVARAEALVSEYRGAIRSARAKLARIIGIRAHELPTLNPDPSLGFMPAGQNLSATPQRADITAASRREKAASAEVSKAKRAYFPEISLFASAGWYGADDLGDVRGAGTDAAEGFEDDYVLGVRLQMPLLDGGLRSAQVRKARAQADAARARTQDLRLAVQEELEQARAAIDTAAAQVEAYSSAYTSALEARRIEHLKYASGKGTMNDLLDAEAEELEALAQLKRSRYALASAGLEYRLAAGMMEEVPSGL
jgi:TolC family type I secretion outer membrane protein